LFVKISYDADAFSQDVIDRIGRYMEKAVEWMIAHPDGLMADAVIMPDEERSLVLDTWTRNDAVKTGHTTLLEIFGDAVLKYPDESALKFRGESITYSELDQRSDALAATLRRDCSSTSGKEFPPEATRW
jgi:non-ribosomal peptide synthetase component F